MPVIVIIRPAILAPRRAILRRVLARIGVRLDRYMMKVIRQVGFDAAWRSLFDGVLS